MPTRIQTKIPVLPKDQLTFLNSLIFCNRPLNFRAKWKRQPICKPLRGIVKPEGSNWLLFSADHQCTHLSAKYHRLWIACNWQVGQSFPLLVNRWVISFSNQLYSSSHIKALDTFVSRFWSCKLLLELSSQWLPGGPKIISVTVPCDRTRGSWALSL